MKRNLATLVTVLALGATALTCSPTVKNSPTPTYTPQIKNQEENRESLYCFIQSLIIDNGRLVAAKLVVNEPNPPQKWDELLCRDNETAPYFVGIMLPSTWDGMNLSMDDIVKDVSDYQQQNSEKWKRLEVWMGTKGDVFTGFLVVTYEKPPQLRQSVNDVPAYRRLAEDLFRIVEKYATLKSTIA